MARLKGDRLIALGNVGLFKTNYVMCPHSDFGACFAAWQNCSGSGVKKSSLILHIIYSAYHLLFSCAFCTFLPCRGCREIPKSWCIMLTLDSKAWGQHMVISYQELASNKWVKIKKTVLSYANIRPSLIMPLRISAIDLSKFCSPELPQSLFHVIGKCCFATFPVCDPHAVQIALISLTAWIMQLCEVGRASKQRQMKIWNCAVEGKY